MCDCKSYCDCVQQVTFAGIPIPLTMEMILDAMADALYQRRYYGHISVDLDMSNKRNRQYRAFRDRILRMDAEKSIALAAYKSLNSRNATEYGELWEDFQLQKKRLFEQAHHLDDAEKRIAKRDESLDQYQATLQALNVQIADKDARIAELEGGLDGLLDGLDANYDERHGLTNSEWIYRVGKARMVLKESNQ